MALLCALLLIHLVLAWSGPATALTSQSGGTVGTCTRIAAGLPARHRNRFHPRTATARASAQTEAAPEDRTRASFVVRIPEKVWRAAASEHRARIRSLLEPGLVGLDHPSMASLRKRFLEMEEDDRWSTMLDPKHPVYNFLVEYYGLKGLKGPKRLARWSPAIGLFFAGDNHNNGPCGESGADPHTEREAKPAEGVRVRRIESLGEYYELSAAHFDDDRDNNHKNNPRIDYSADRCVFLEGATPDDFGSTLHLRGAEWIGGDVESIGGGGDDHEIHPIPSGIASDLKGVLYRPTASRNGAAREDRCGETPPLSRATSLLWYRSVLEATASNDPVLHCYGLHEWAMQYQPEGAREPPSGRYQSHLALRVSRTTINETVERKGVSCTHVDALRFFAPAAGPLNHHGASLERTDQLGLEQPACVHAHMDLLKIALRLVPYCDPGLLLDVLGVALRARALDVGASPNDCSSYRCRSWGNATAAATAAAAGTTTPIRTIPIETPAGRALYKELQKELMAEAAPIRERLLSNYETVLRTMYTPDQLEEASENPSDERFARAEPGGLPWRKNLLERVA
ncbi:unnamed protein product [Pseudo-nitzschia multistriata]|uniref:Uncharacterized protein n=1 Tax=Pseudo-nitzschia multistriata TaxID=183589 RepID=A0A448ZGG1_9STRA|nr:unnamed protein product [Pseudo-nitzschia multistriata]